MSEAWQQEKEFLDYMFVSLHHHGANADETEQKATKTHHHRRAGRISSSGSNDGSSSGNKKSPIRSTAAPGQDVSPLVPPAGLDHLDNLCKLMEQLGELKDANSRLQKRVQYLEDMKTLQEMHQELDMLDSASPLLSEKTGQSAEKEVDRSIDSLDSGDVLCSSTTNVQETAKEGESSKKSDKLHHHHHHHRLKKPGEVRYRERSKSVGYDDPPIPDGDGVTDDYSAGPVSLTGTSGNPHPPEVFLPTPPPPPPTTLAVIVPPPARTKTKVSKWTRVKEAFRWEKAHVDSAAGHKAVSKPSTQPPRQLQEVPPASRPTVSTTTTPESPADHAVMKSGEQSPVFLLSRSRRSASSRTSSSSSSSLSECPLESEILKSFADAQELPLFRMEKRTSSPEAKTVAATGSMSEDSGGGLRLQDVKRFHRQSTISCDASFAATTAPISGPIADIPPLPEADPPPSPSLPETVGNSSGKKGGPESPSRRKTSSKLTATDEHQLYVADDSGSFIASLRSQLKPINEWTAKWHHELIKTNNTPVAAVGGSVSSPNSGGQVDQAVASARSSLSVPASPNQHQAFTFDEYPEAGLEHGTASRDTSPARTNHNKKHSESNPSASASAAGGMEGGQQTPSPTWMISTSRPAYNPGSLLNSISPEFRKKVEVWERLKSGLSSGMEGTTAQSSSTGTSQQKKSTASAISEMNSPDWNDVGKRRSESSDKLPPAFKKKLAEWEIRKAVAGKSDREVEELQKILPQDFNRKLQEWERMKAAAAAGAKMAPPVSPGLERQGSGKHSQNRGSGSNHRGGGSGSGGKSGKSGGEERDKKEKDLQWLEKELQKIEREKLRLEREREKYMERESRLEKIREAMKHQPPSSSAGGRGGARQGDEICIRTSTGEFRFQGLSRKFTKKLFQWEEQKGIRPEASTIALLDGAYRPPGTVGHHSPFPHHHPDSPGEVEHKGSVVSGSAVMARPTSLALLGRSKSESSVADLVSASVHSQPSSLSLNDAESAADFDRRLAGMDQTDEGSQAVTGPGAILVEVEDVLEENPAVVEIPEIKPQAPVYSIASAEFRQTINLSEPESEPMFKVSKGPPAEHPGSIQRNDSVRTEASFKLLEENLSLLDRLRAKGEIVKYLEFQMNSIEGDMAGVASTQTEEMVRLQEEEETCLSDQDEVSAEGNSSTVDRLKQRIIHLENRGQQLKAEKEQLQAVYNKQCSQQIQIVRHLVEKMQQLRSVAPLSPSDPESLMRLDALTSELLREAQELEASLRHPQRLTDPIGKGGMQMLSIKANQLKEEFERLRSIDSDVESVEDSPPPQPLPLPPPPPAQEMSTAARKKIFVETRRLVFAPVESDPSDETARPVQQSAQQEQSEGSSPSSWRRNSRPTEEVRSVRTTAPNIRRMIDMYHQRVTGAGRERPSLPAAPTLRMRFESPMMDRSSSSTPPLAPSDASSNTPPTEEISNSMAIQQPTHLCKSQSTGAMLTAESADSATPLQPNSVLRSRSGIHIHASAGVPCIRNPSFFRKSPLDPSIDDLLQKYRNGRQHHRPLQSVPDLPKSPTSLNPERAVRLKQAREAFLTVGPGAIKVPETRVSPATPTPPTTPQPSHIVPDIILDPCPETPSPPSASTAVTAPLPIPERVASSSCPSSPGLRRPNSATPTSTNPNSRRSWLKQPTKFFFSSKPKTP